jgi:predicted DNA-binding helix-hairpin-helix protein
MVIGATPENDLQILAAANAFYKKMNMKRVYYSGYIPISSDNRLPAVGTPVPIVRENRLYQADWLMRFYGFKVNEIISIEQPNLDMDIDPKLSWALRNINIFPVDINKADVELIMRVPGIGIQSAHKICAARKFSKLNWEHIQKIGVQLSKARHFIVCNSPDFQRKELTPVQIKHSILALGNSKYNANFSPQLRIF